MIAEFQKHPTLPTHISFPPSPSRCTDMLIRLRPEQRAAPDTPLRLTHSSTSRTAITTATVFSIIVALLLLQQFITITTILMHLSSQLDQPCLQHLPLRCRCMIIIALTTIPPLVIPSSNSSTSHRHNRCILLLLRQQCRLPDGPLA